MKLPARFALMALGAGIAALMLANMSVQRFAEAATPTPVATQEPAEAPDGSETPGTEIATQTETPTIQPTPSVAAATVTIVASSPTTAAGSGTQSAAAARGTPRLPETGVGRTNRGERTGWVALLSGLIGATLVLAGLGRRRAS
jgi:hypothetical protein